MASPRSSHHPSPSYATNPRVHPYAPAHGHPHRPRNRSSSAEGSHLPPSPPHSRRDSSQSPPADQVKKGAAAPVDSSDNFYDDLPPAPSSLKSILDSFRRSGEGDRDLLMAILKAKSAEEERLTAVIQTRLAILQARLNLNAMQTQVQLQQITPPFDPSTFPHPFPGPHPGERSRSSRNTSQPESPVSSHMPTTHQYPAYSHGQRSPYGSQRDDRERIRLPPLRDDDQRLSHSPATTVERRSTGGLEMLLEGVREAERKERV